jgi:hypothetical protein
VGGLRRWCTRAGGAKGFVEVEAPLLLEQLRLDVLDEGAQEHQRSLAVSGLGGHLLAEVVDHGDQLVVGVLERPLRNRGLVPWFVSGVVVAHRRAAVG